MRRTLTISPYFLGMLSAYRRPASHTRCATLLLSLSLITQKLGGAGSYPLSYLTIDLELATSLVYMAYLYIHTQYLESDMIVCSDHPYEPLCRLMPHVNTEIYKLTSSSRAIMSLQSRTIYLASAVEPEEFYFIRCRTRVVYASGILDNRLQNNGCARCSLIIRHTMNLLV